MIGKATVLSLLAAAGLAAAESHTVNWKVKHERCYTIRPVTIR